MERRGRSAAAPLSLSLSLFSLLFFAYLVLATDVPNGERDVLVLDGLDVEAWLMVKRRRRKEREK